MKGICMRNSVRLEKTKLNEESALQPTCPCIVLGNNTIIILHLTSYPDAPFTRLYQGAPASSSYKAMSPEQLSVQQGHH